MKEKEMFQKTARRVSKIVWRVVGACIVLATIVAVILYLQNEKLRDAQVNHREENLAVAEEPAYREIAWDCTVESDIIYGQAEGVNGQEDLKLDVYCTTKEGSNPAIILFHGGGLTSGDKGSAGLIKSLATDFAGMGYVVVVPNYRLSAQGNDAAMKKAMEDAKAAYEWVLANGADYGVNTDYVAIGGYSAGADISINLCYSGVHEDLNRDSLFAIIDISGSSIYYSMTDKMVPGCVIVHGTEDTTVRFSNSEKVARKLENRGVDVQFHPLEGLNHDLLSRYDEVRNTIAEYLYERLTGKEVTIDIESEVNPEYQKVLQRMENGMSYEVNQLDVKLDGSLDEWDGVQSIKLDQIKDAGEAIPAKEDFSGQVMLAWNESSPTTLYIAATVTDDDIANAVPADGKWYKDDCLEIVFDTSTEQALQQLAKWVIGAGSSDLSVLATAENTVVATSKSGNKTVYELSIDISKVPAGTYQGEGDLGFAVGANIGFSICYNDGEDGDRQHQIGWTKGKSSDRTTLGTLCFR